MPDVNDRRDFFAGLAMQAIVLAMLTDKTVARHIAEADSPEAKVAKNAFCYADAMLAESEGHDAG